MVGVFAGHVHCNNFCCRSNATNLCFGAHSAAGHYYCPSKDVHIDAQDPDFLSRMEESPIGFGMRLIEVTTQEDGTWRVDTHIALTNGSIIHPAVLAKG